MRTFVASTVLVVLVACGGIEPLPKPYAKPSLAPTTASPTRAETGPAETGPSTTERISGASQWGRSPRPTTIVASRRGEIVLISSWDGSVIRTIAGRTATRGQDVPLVLSPDRKTVYFTVALNDRCHEIRAVSVTGATSKRVAAGRSPDVSPDGERLAYVAIDDCKSWRDYVVVLDLRTGDEREWRFPTEWDGAAVGDVLWGPDPRFVLVHGCGADMCVPMMLDPSGSDGRLDGAPYGPGLEPGNPLTSFDDQPFTMTSMAVRREYNSVAFSVAYPDEGPDAIFPTLEYNARSDRLRRIFSTRAAPLDFDASGDHLLYLAAGKLFRYDGRQRLSLGRGFADAAW